jgi:hypothetical protein
MKWNLRLAAANRGIWKASELQRLLADHGLVIPAVVVAWKRAPAGDWAAWPPASADEAPVAQASSESVARTRQRQRGSRS